MTRESSFIRCALASTAALIAAAGLARPATGVGAGVPELPGVGLRQEPLESVAVGLVLVTVVVRDGDRYASGLGKDDFELHVDGQPVPIATFEHRRDAPVSLVILQDLSGSMANQGKLAISREILGHIIDSAGPEDEVAVVTFASGQARVEVPFTSDFGVLEEAMASWRGYGTTGLHDAVAWLPEISVAGRRPKRAALLLTDGNDSASELTPASAHSVVRRAQLPVYVFGFTGDVSPRNRGAGAAVETTLRQLAVGTAGRYYSLERTGDWKEAAIEVAADLRHQYVLGFALGTGDTRFHEISLRVRGSDPTDVFARQGYEGPPPRLDSQP